MTESAPRYIYLASDGLALTVIDSQVIEPLRWLAIRGAAFDLVVMVGLRAWWRDRRQNRKKLFAVREALKPSRVWLCLNPFPWILLRRLWLSAMLGSLVFGDVVRRKAVLCHCRGHFTASAGSLVSRILPRVRYIFDMRGDVANETMMSVGWTGAASDRRGAAVCEKIKRDEAASIKNASGIICVSESLGRKISKEYPNTIGKLVVIPCLAPERLFFFDPSVRAAKRKMLGLENRRVVVYAGALKAPWHIPDALFGHFKAWSCLDESLHFLVVTRDPDTAFTMVRKYAIPAAVFTILSVSHREVATLLMAGDCGLLLREDHQLNKVASPTKFAEYAMTGLPVMASRGIGDLDELITAQGLGVILDKLDSTEESFIVLRKALALPSENSCRAERAERARRQFSAEVGNEKRLRLYAKAGTP